MIKNTLFELIKIGLGKTVPDHLPRCDDWNALMELSYSQGVGGVVLAGLTKVYDVMPKTISFSKDWIQINILLKWYGLQNVIEKKYAANKKTIVKLGLFFSDHQLPMMLLKGYGLSLNYPNPLFRPSGDIDIYMYGHREVSDKLVKSNLSVAIDNSHHHHTVFYYNSQPIENHYDFINIHSHKSNKAIEKHFKKLADEKYGEQIMKNVYLPNPLLELEFTLRHAAGHFSSGEMLIRHILDWLLLVEKKNDKFNWDLFWNDVRWMGMKKFVCAIIKIGVDYLGFKKSIFHLPSDINIKEQLIDRIISDTLFPRHPRRPNDDGIVYVVWLIQRWWLNRWRHKLVYKDSLFSTFFSQLRSHLLKPASLQNKKCANI